MRRVSCKLDVSAAWQQTRVAWTVRRILQAAAKALSARTSEMTDHIPHFCCSFTAESLALEPPCGATAAVSRALRRVGALTDSPTRARDSPDGDRQA